MPTKRTSRRKSSKGSRTSKSIKNQKSKTLSGTKKTWEKFLKNKDSKKVLQDSWKQQNPQKHFSKTIKKLHKKYSNKKS